MSPEIFMEDFERTDNSDYLHGVIGRSLIVATRFDSMCTELSMALEIKTGALYLINSDEEFEQFTSKAESKYRSLNSTIQSFKVNEGLSLILHQARKARNEIVHSVTKGLEGCIDTRICNHDFILNISKLIEKVIEGDIIISFLMSDIYNEPMLNNASLNMYKGKVIKWVVEA